MLLASLLLPAVAFASGSWAVPRFTPTWAELERDLRLLGLRKRPTARPPVARAAPAATVAANGAPPPGGTRVPAQTTPGAEVAGKPTTLSNAPDSTNTSVEPPNTGPGPVCKCPEPLPPPKCPDVAPIAGPADAADKKVLKKN